MSRWWARNVSRRQFALIFHNIVAGHHFERLRSANYDNGVLICGNHRSYLDPFAIAVNAIPHIPRGIRLIAPARTEGLFDKPWGILVNFSLTFMNMYPPVVRSARGAIWGKQVIRILTEILLKGRSAVFIHPEGGRNKGSDPYDLLPAKPGLCKIIHSTRAEVYPVFLQGFPRTPKGIVSAKLRRGARANPLVHAVMGPAIDFSAERAKPASPDVYREIGQRLMDAIRTCSAEERELRASAAAIRAIPSSTVTAGS
jgi:1-acyl-sn-glycerol-3-phosphate acyltransferase